MNTRNERKLTLRGLSSRQFWRVVSAFENRVWRLKESGDYPEEQEDKAILRALISHLYTLEKGERQGNQYSG